jgi:hypothetical protein
MFHGLDRRLHSSVSGYDDHQRFRALSLDLPQGFKTIRTGQSQVEQHGVDGLSLQQAIGVFGGIGDMRSKTQGAGDFAASFPDGAFVIDDEEVEKIGGQNLRCGERWTYGY